MLAKLCTEEGILSDREPLGGIRDRSQSQRQGNLMGQSIEC